MATWNTAADIRTKWADAAQLDDDELDELLEVAKADVIAYAPPLPAEQPASTIPTAWRLAQRMQVKNLYAAGAVDASGGMGDGESFPLKPHPLDWHIKQILRPKRGVPFVG